MRSAEAGWLASALALAGALALVFAWGTSTSAHLDTAFEHERSLDSETIGDLLERVRADHQPPLAPLVSWAFVKAGFTGLDAHRVAWGLVLAAALVLLSPRWARAARAAPGPSPPADRWRGLLLVLHPGVAAVLLMVRYSSLVGVLWLPLYAMTVRAARQKDPSAARWSGFLLGVLSLASYTAAIAAVGVLVTTVATGAIRDRR